nr:isoform 2 of probable lrr receptor-like serine/threonine-protein kinase rfk1 [Quercus suber]
MRVDSRDPSHQISLLNNLLELRISDVKGPNQDFPMLRNMTGIGRLQFSTYIVKLCKFFELMMVDLIFGYAV